jgi:type IX secretion system substrate protein
MKKIVLYFLIAIVSTPCSAQWKFVGSGDLSGNGDAGGVFALGVHDSVLFRSTSPEGVFRYTFAQGWANANLNLGNINSFGTMGRYFFAGNVGNPSYYTTNNGSNWKATGIATPVCSDGKYLFAYGGTGIYHSGDSGETWTLSQSNVTVNNFDTIGVCIFANTSSGYWRSTDSGNTNTWAKITPPVGLSLSEYAVIDTQIFAGGVGVFRSTDSGGTWSQHTLTNRTVNALVSYGKYLFAGTDTGVFVSSDLGMTWRDVSDSMGGGSVSGTLGHPDVTLLAVLDTQLFAAVNTGTNGFENFGYVAARPIVEMIDSSKSAVVATARSGDSIQVYPNPATGLVTILAGGTSIYGVSVLNVLGDVVLDLPNLRESEITLDISKIPSGTYILQINTEGGSITRRVVIMH